MHKQVSLRRVLRPKILLSLGLAAGVLALGGWFYWYNQTPVVGVVHEAAPESRVAAVTSARFNGKAVAFDYSTAYQTVENKDSSPPPVTEQYGLGKHDPAKGSDRISITVKNASGNTMLEDSAYAFRRNEASQYIASDMAVAGRTVKKMAKKDGSEITYFIPSPVGKNAYAIVSATSTNPDTAFGEEANRLVGSFVWR